MEDESWEQNTNSTNRIKGEWMLDGTDMIFYFNYFFYLKVASYSIKIPTLAIYSFLSCIPVICASMSFPH